MKSPPKMVGISITGKCNLNCRYCFYNNEMEGLRDLTTMEWIPFIKHLGEIGVMSVVLTGGEPFLHPDIFRLVDEIVDSRMRYCFLSNGTLITEKIINEFEKGKRRIRLNYIQVSIDGSRAEIHNQSRPDSFDRAVRGLKRLKEAGLPRAVRMTINRANVKDLEETARFLLEDLELDSFGTNAALPIGSGCRSDAGMTLNAQENLYAMKILGRLIEKYPGRITADAGPQVNRRMYSQMIHARNTGEMSKTWKMGYLTACGCVFSRVDVLHDGSIVPCNMLPDLVMGNIKTDSFLDIWRTHPTITAMRERRKIPMSLVPGCESCEWKWYCNGGCPGIAHQLTGNFNYANPQDCFRNFLKGIGPHNESKFKNMQW